VPRRKTERTSAPGTNELHQILTHAELTTLKFRIPSHSACLGVRTQLPKAITSDALTRGTGFPGVQTEIRRCPRRGASQATAQRKDFAATVANHPPETDSFSFLVSRSLRGGALPERSRLVIRQLLTAIFTAASRPSDESGTPKSGQTNRSQFLLGGLPRPKPLNSSGCPAQASLGPRGPAFRVLCEGWGFSRRHLKVGILTFAPYHACN
jgi:hypothetical protein